MPFNVDGSLRPYTIDEVTAFNIRWRGVRDGSTPTLSFEINSNRMETACFVTWAKWKDAVDFFVGTSSTYIGEDDEAHISRLLPFSFDTMPGLICSKVTKVSGHKFLGTHDDDGLPQYKDAEISLLFESPSYKVLSDDDIENELDRYIEIGPAQGSAEVLSMHGGVLKFRRDPAGPTPGALPDGIPVPWNTVNKPIPEETFTVTWHRIPFDAAKEVSSLAARLYGDGTQENVPYLSVINTVELFGRPVGTLLLKAARRIRDKAPTPIGTLEYRVEFDLCFRPSGWNWLWFSNASFPDVNGFYMVTSGTAFKTADEVGDKESLYAARDLQDLFKP
jgi:hypothetical protein